MWTKFRGLIVTYYASFWCSQPSCDAVILFLCSAFHWHSLAWEIYRRTGKTQLGYKCESKEISWWWTHLMENNECMLFLIHIKPTWNSYTQTVQGRYRCSTLCSQQASFRSTAFQNESSSPNSFNSLCFCHKTVSFHLSKPVAVSAFVSFLYRHHSPVIFIWILCIWQRCQWADTDGLESTHLLWYFVILIIVKCLRSSCATAFFSASVAQFNFWMSPYCLEVLYLPCSL